MGNGASPYPGLQTSYASSPDLAMILEEIMPDYKRRVMETGGLTPDRFNAVERIQRGGGQEFGGGLQTANQDQLDYLLFLTDSEMRKDLQKQILGRQSARQADVAAVSGQLGQIPGMAPQRGGSAYEDIRPWWGKFIKSYQRPPTGDN